MPIRLQKILSAAGVASRRMAETLITQGRVTVNGKTVMELGTKAEPGVDEIKVDGRRLPQPKHTHYILLNKPRGYITSRSDPQHRPTVIDLLARGGVRDYIYPVGRLDFDSEGLLLLTSDGDLAARLTHPRHGVAREYEVRVRGVPDRHALDRLARGVSIDGRRTATAEVRLGRVYESESGPQGILSLVIHEGRNRQVRKMCDAIGHPVVQLKRVRIGPIADDRLKPGHFRALTPGEIGALKKGAPGPAFKRLRPERGAASLRQGYGGPPKLQRRRESPRESERGWGPASAEKDSDRPTAKESPTRGRRAPARPRRSRPDRLRRG